MASAPKSIDRSPTLEQVLRRVKRRIRAYVAVDGLARFVAFGCLTFWLAFAIDWLFEPTSKIRLIVVGVLAAAIVVALYRVLLRRFFARFADRSVAILLERRFRNLDDALLTAIDHPSDRSKAKARDSALSAPAQAMLEATRLEARSKLAGAHLGELFDPRPRRRALAAALLLGLSITGFALAVPQIFYLGVDRLAGRTNELYPRKTRLIAKGFNENNEVVLAKGADFDLIVQADAKMEIPSRIDLYYESEDGSVTHEDFMEKEGVAKPNVDEFQNYKLRLPGIASTLILDIRGNDSRLRDYKIRVVDRPQITMMLKVKSPEYTKRSDIPIAVTGVMPVAQYSFVSVVAQANKPLRSAVVDRPDGKGGVISDKHEFSPTDDTATEFIFDLGRLDADLTATIQLRDLDGIDGAAKLSLQAVVDGPPTFKDLARNGVSESVTPQAMLPFVGKIIDDHGVARLWFDYQFDGLDSQEVGLRKTSAGGREIALAGEEYLDLRELAPGGASAPLAPGRAVTVVLKARDNRELPADLKRPDAPDGNVAAGDSFSFTIVSDTDLLRLLEGREIMLREQFKALIEKVTRDRDSLVDVGKAESAAKDGDEDAPRNRDKIIVEQARSHSEENRRETLVVSDGFTAIVAELVNNRIPDSDNLRGRLAKDIAGPLRSLGKLPDDEPKDPVLRGFPAYQAKLTALHLTVDRATKDAAAIDEARRDAIKSADAILIEMNVVLKKMQELESFKEAVDLLRSIIALQKDIGDKTKATRTRDFKERLKGLAD